MSLRKLFALPLLVMLALPASAGPLAGPCSSSASASPSCCCADRVPSAKPCHCDVGPRPEPVAPPLGLPEHPSEATRSDSPHGLVAGVVDSDPPATVPADPRLGRAAERVRSPQGLFLRHCVFLI